MQAAAQHKQSDIENDLATIAEALKGDARARKHINTLIEPVIRYQSERFCKRFCSENRYLYHCTLANPISQAPRDALFCEWGNAGYGWMLDELTNNNRLAQYEGLNGARLFDYLYHIANSLPFYERWKNWRFGRRVHVPDYIKDISPHAARAYMAIRSGDNAPLVAQKLGVSEHDADELTQKIIIVLTQRGKLHLLQAEQYVSLTQFDHTAEDTSSQTDIASFDIDVEDIERNQILGAAWEKLDAVEQFVLEAMLIEEQDAHDVLEALKQHNIRINEKIPPDKTDRQQLYYFRRKTLAKLAKFAGITDE